MSLELKYPRWQEPLAAAILEFDPQEKSLKIQRAEEAIASRLEELGREGKDNEHERRLLHDGISILRTFKQDSSPHKRPNLRKRTP